MIKNWIVGDKCSYAWSALLPKVMYHNSYNVYVETRDFNRSLKAAVVCINMCLRDQQQL
jgi:hypothetical protein